MVFHEVTPQGRKTLEKKSTGAQNSVSRFRDSLRLVDVATIIYVSVVGLILLFFHRGVEAWPYFLFVHIFVLGFIPGLITIERKSRFKMVTILREIYPFFLYPFMFLEVSLIINVLFPFWLEPYLISFDNLLFGHHPTVWVQDLFNRSLTEYMAFSYWSYYILLPLTGFVLFVQKDKSLFRSFVFNLSLTLYICYFSYLFLTARGPHETLAHLHLEREVAGFFDNWVKTIQENAAISGAAFPSSHVTAVWISWIYLFRFRKWLGFVVLPLVLSLSFSVVYMQYHYAIDPIAGIVLICLSYPLGRKLEKNQKRRRAEVK